MSAIVIGGRGLRNTVVAVSMVIAIGFTAAQGATAKAAKDAGEQGKAVIAAARYLQGPGFIDPMLAAVNTDTLLTVQVDRGWTRMNKAQKVDFLERINGAALSASGGIAMDIQVTVSGAKVAASTFAAGQQSMRLLAE
jgi:hypothetical protein